MTELARLAGWTVPEDEIDRLGHMNIQFYGLRAALGCGRMLERIGLGPPELAARGLTVSTVDQHTMYRREQLANSPLSIFGGVAAAGPERIAVYLEIRNDRTGDLAATFLSSLQLQDRATRMELRFPDALVEAANARQATPPARSQPRSLPLERMAADLTTGDLARAGVESHLRRVVGAADCDADGFVRPAQPRRIGAATPPSQGVMDQVWHCVDGFAWPALEARTLTLASPRLGDVLDTYTALLAVTHKILQWGTWVFEARSGQLVSVSRQVNIFFDVAARQTRDLPADVQARLSALARPALAPKGHR